jgi:hypothetical protein
MKPLLRDKDSFKPEYLIIFEYSCGIIRKDYHPSREYRYALRANASN